MTTLAAWTTATRISHHILLVFFSDGKSQMHAEIVLCVSPGVVQYKMMAHSSYLQEENSSLLGSHPLVAIVMFRVFVVSHLNFCCSLLPLCCS